MSPADLPWSASLPCTTTFSEDWVWCDCESAGYVTVLYLSEAEALAEFEDATAHVPRPRADSSAEEQSTEETKQSRNRARHQFFSVFSPAPGTT